MSHEALKGMTVLVSNSEWDATYKARVTDVLTEDAIDVRVLGNLPDVLTTFNLVAILHKSKAVDGSIYWENEDV